MVSLCLFVMFRKHEIKGLFIYLFIYSLECSEVAVTEFLSQIPICLVKRSFGD